MQAPGQLLVPGGRAGEAAVEPAEEAALAGPGLGGFEQGGAQGRGQDEGHQDREDHGRDHGDGELAVDDARGAAEEGHGHEHGRQDQGDADQGAGDLGHGQVGRVAGREAVLVHDALDVLDHDDGVVHQQADGQDHGEHGQGVDGVAESRQHAEGAEQDHGHGDGRDEGGPEVLQEEVHDQEDQDHGFKQRADHLLDGDAHEGRRVEGGYDLHARRES
ncbi:hypothetical protein DSECCO2_489720 [anaerobic digester metagenome]